MLGIVLFRFFAGKQLHLYGNKFEPFAFKTFYAFAYQATPDTIRLKHDKRLFIHFWIPLN